MKLPPNGRIPSLDVLRAFRWRVRCQAGLLGRVLNSRPLVWMGVISYSFYLWQQLFLNRYSGAWMAGFSAKSGVCFCRSTGFLLADRTPRSAIAAMAGAKNFL